MHENHVYINYCTSNSNMEFRLFLETLIIPQAKATKDYGFLLLKIDCKLARLCLSTKKYLNGHGAFRTV